MFKKLKFLLPILLLVVGITLISPQKVLAEQITDYNVQIKLNQDSSINVLEGITYDFGTEVRHGIFRNIPSTVTNVEGKKFKLDIDVESVTTLNNKVVPYSESYSNDELVLKIGDPNSTVSGSKIYFINYTVKGAATYFADHDELYWNTVGTGWDVPISHVNVGIDLFDLHGLTKSNTKLVCYNGPQGSTTQQCSAALDIPISTVVSSLPLNSHEGLTFALWLPKGTLQVHEPKLVTFTDSIPSGLIFGVVITLITLVFCVIYWFINGRDPSDNTVLVRMYDPPKGPDGKDLTPIEVGTIVNESIKPQDISAEVINLAVLKYITIREEGSNLLGGLIKNKKTILEKGPKLKEDFASFLQLKTHQQDIIKAFGLDVADSVDLSLIDPSMPKQFTLIKKNLFQSLTDNGYFQGNPEKIRTRFGTIGGIGFFIAVILHVFSLLGAVATLTIFALIMPKKTKQGVEAKRYALGLKEFLVSQDRQFEFQEKNFYMFEKLLPYAISFGVAKVWAKKFEDLTNYKPDWYTSNSIATFNAINLTNSITTTITSSIGTSSGFSSSGGSGGSSGGGGGGGGGGSW